MKIFDRFLIPMTTFCYYKRKKLHANVL